MPRFGFCTDSSKSLQNLLFVLGEGCTDGSLGPGQKYSVNRVLLSTKCGNATLGIDMLRVGREQMACGNVVLRYLYKSGRQYSVYCRYKSDPDSLRWWRSIATAQEACNELTGNRPLPTRYVRIRHLHLGWGANITPHQWL